LKCSKKKIQPSIELSRGAKRGRGVKLLPQRTWKQKGGGGKAPRKGYALRYPRDNQSELAGMKMIRESEESTMKKTEAKKSFPVNRREKLSLRTVSMDGKFGGGSEAGCPGMATKLMTVPLRRGR